MCSRTRSVSGTRPTCNIAPVLIRFSGFVGSPPKTRTRPELGCNNPSSNFTAVVFPAPFGPSSATDPSGRHTEINATQRLDASIILVHAFETGDDHDQEQSYRCAALIHGCDHLQSFRLCSTPSAGNRDSYFPLSDCIFAERQTSRQCHPSRSRRDKCHPLLAL